MRRPPSTITSISLFLLAALVPACTSAEAPDAATDDAMAQATAEACVKNGCGRTSAITGSSAQIRSSSSKVQASSSNTKIGKVSVQQQLGELGAQISPTEIRIVLSSAVLFDFDQSTLRADAIVTLTKVLGVLNSKELAGKKISIEGHTDWVGTDEYNLKLSERRSASVAEWLIASHVAKARISTTGFGESRPVDSNETGSGRQRNRRVEIVISR